MKKSNPFLANVPTDIKEMNIKQLIGMTLYWQLVTTKSDNTASLINAISMFCDIDKEDAANLSVEGLKVLSDSIGKAFVSVRDFYAESVESGGIALSFKAIPDTTEIFYTKIELEMCSAWRLWKKAKLYYKVRKLSKGKTYETITDFERMPFALFERLRDDTSAKIKAFGDQYWLTWSLIPKLMALICWKEGEKKVIEKGGSYGIDDERLARLDQAFLSVAAMDGINILCFFLRVHHGYSTSQFLRQCLNLYQTLNTPQFKQEKPSPKNGE